MQQFGRSEGSAEFGAGGNGDKFFFFFLDTAITSSIMYPMQSCFFACVGNGFQTK